MVRFWHWLMAGALAMFLACPSAIAGDDDFTGTSSNDGSRVSGWSPGDLSELGSKTRGSATAPSGFTGPWSKFTATSYCTNASPGSENTDIFCPRAVSVCAANQDVQGRGPAVWIWRSYVNADDQPVTADNAPLSAPQWERIGFTCFPQAVPGAGRTLTLADIQAAFHDTKFSVPELAIQPRKGRTLVNLKTFYQTTFPTTGYAPGATDTTTLLGHQVRIRPSLVSAVYDFGDGTTSASTTSLGGTYPNGDITHTYRHKGTVQPRVDVTYTADFTVDGSDWIPINDTVTITGAPATLEVLEARAQLVP